MNFGFDWLDFVAVPLETMADVDPKVRPRRRSSCSRPTTQQHNDIVKRIANAILAERHHGVDDFQIFDFSRIMDKFTGVLRIMSIIVGFIAGIALLVGGVGVMNMMLVSVSERVREIGIRKAIGANPSDIGAPVPARGDRARRASGGIIGVGGGVGMALRRVGAHPPLQADVGHRHRRRQRRSSRSCVSFGVGLLFGYFPARRAAKLDAITAIRGA